MSKLIKVPQDQWCALLQHVIEAEAGKAEALLAEYYELGGTEQVFYRHKEFPATLWVEYLFSQKSCTPPTFEQEYVVPLRAKKYQELRVEIDKVGVEVSSVLKSAEQRSRKKGEAK